MLIALLFVLAILLFLLDAIRPDIFPKVGKTALGLASATFALLILSGHLRSLF